MAYDDEPYWFDKSKAAIEPKKHKEKKHDSVGRFIPNADYVMEHIEKEPRAANPSPLLMEYMQKTNKDSPND